MQGFVETAPESESFGNFTTYDLQLFDVAGRLPDKIANIRRKLAAIPVAFDETTCGNLLAEFTVACDPEKASCSSINERSYQVRCVVAPNITETN